MLIFQGVGSWSTFLFKVLSGGLSSSPREASVVTCVSYIPEVYNWTWRSALGKGDSFWTPSFLGSMFTSGGAALLSLSSSQLYYFFHIPSLSTKSSSLLAMSLSKHITTAFGTTQEVPKKKVSIRVNTFLQWVSPLFFRKMNLFLR